MSWREDSPYRRIDACFGHRRLKLCQNKTKTMLELTFAYHFVFEARRALPNKLE